MTTLTEKMSETSRCILRYVPDLGWSATDRELARDDELVWKESPVKALEWIGRGCRLGITLSEHEHSVLRAVTDRADRWACEWFMNYWMRPFVAPEPHIA